MKPTTLFTLLCASTLDLASANPIKQQRSELSKRHVTPKAVCAGPYGGKVADVPGATPRRQIIEAEGLMPGTQRVKIRYGPYSVPGMMKKSIMGERGALWNCGDDQIEKPCDDCVLTKVVAGLEYPNGTNANIDTGMWLHHMVAVAQGPERWDPLCVKENFSLPHLVLGSTPQNSERIFASGNERTPIDFASSGVNGGKIGYHLKQSDTLKFIVDLMNMNMDDRTMYMTLTWDVVANPSKDYVHARPIWFDVDQCALSEVDVTKKMLREKKFTITSEAWTPNLEGDIILMGGHLHDGGMSIEFSSDGKNTVCDSAASYGTTPEFIFDQASSMMGSDIATKHISNMTICDKLPSKVEKNQSWLIRGTYDYGAYPGNFEDGHPQDIMAIGLLYVAVPMADLPKPPA